RCYQCTRRVPCAPFIDHEPGSMLWIEPFHGLPMLLDNCLCAQAFAKDRIPLFSRGPFWNHFGVAEIRVEMQRETVRLFAMHGFEEAGRPPNVGVARVSAGASRHQKRLRREGGELSDELSVEGRILGGLHVAAATPRLVAYPPIPNSKRFLLPIGSPFICHSQSSQRSVAIGDPVVKLLRSARAYIR